MFKHMKSNEEPELTSGKQLFYIIWNYKFYVGFITLIFPVALALSPIYNNKLWTTAIRITLPDEMALRWLNDPLPTKKIPEGCKAPEELSPQKSFQQLFHAASSIQYQEKFQVQFENHNKTILPSGHSFIATGANYIFEGSLRTVMPYSTNANIGHLEIDTLHPDIAKKWLSEYVAFLDQSLILERRNSLISFYKCTKREELTLIEMDLQQLRRAFSFAERLDISEYAPAFKEENQELPFWRGTKLLTLMIEALEDEKTNIESEIEFIYAQPNTIWSKTPTDELLFITNPSPPRSVPRVSRRNQITQLVLSTLFGFMVGISFVLFIFKKNNGKNN
jgi:LPS O-antigen subunit length determinant protein (WzzB/FepE family)